MSLLADTPGRTLIGNWVRLLSVRGTQLSRGGFRLRHLDHSASRSMLLWSGNWVRGTVLGDQDG